MKKTIQFLVILISLATIVSGLIQLVAPAFVLNFIGGEITTTSIHFFAIIGMFMTLFGGLMVHTVYSPYPQKPAILWSAFQKLGAFAAVSLGVMNGLFAPIALSVAFFDFISGLLFLYYFKLQSKL